MSFDDDGYLSTDVLTFSKQNREQYADLFDLVTEVNRFAHAAKFKFDIQNRDIQAIVVFCLYMRSLESYAASARLAEFNMGRDAEATARIAMEAMFFLKRCIDSEDFVVEFVKSDQATRRKLMNLAKEGKPAFKGIIDIDSERFAEIHRKVSEQVDRENITEKKVLEVARAAGLEEIYDYAYRTLSMSVHPHPRMLSKYGQWNEKDELVGWNMKPTGEFAPLVLFTIVTTLIHTIGFACAFFKIDSSPLAEFEARFKALNEKYKGP